MRIWSDPNTGKHVYLDDLIREFEMVTKTKYTHWVHHKLENFIASKNLIYHGECY